jgi:hypothetical protein
MHGLVLFVAGVLSGLAVQTTMAQNDTAGVVLNHVGHGELEIANRGSGHLVIWLFDHLMLATGR